MWEGGSGLRDASPGLSLQMHFPFCLFLFDGQLVAGDFPPLLRSPDSTFGRVRVEGVQTTGVSVRALPSTPVGWTLRACESSFCPAAAAAAAAAETAAQK